MPLQTGRDICHDNDTSIPYTLDSQRFNSTYDPSYHAEAGSVGDVARTQFLYHFQVPILGTPTKALENSAPNEQHTSEAVPRDYSI
jgi:hypothetical protein